MKKRATTSVPAILSLLIFLLHLGNIHAQAPGTSFANQAGGTETDDGWGIGSDGAGNIYVCGGYNSSITFGSTTLTSSWSRDRDMFLVKYDTAGSVIWAKKGGGTSGSERGRAIAVDQAGNSYVCGYFHSSATFGSTTLTSNGGYDVFIAKYDSTGSLKWIKNAGGTGNDEDAFDIAIDSKGDCYVTGVFSGTATFATGTTLTSSGLLDAFVAKYNANGVFQWVKKMGGPGNDYGYGCVIDPSGNVGVSGAFKDSVNFATGTKLTSSGSADVFIAKYNESTGSLLFAKKAGGSSWEEARGINCDNQGNFYITGNYTGTATFGSGSSASTIISQTYSSSTTRSKDIFTAAYSATGSFKWVKSAGGPQDESGWDLACDNTGHVYIAGYFENNIYFGTYNLINVASHPAFAYKDPFAARYDSSGTFSWAVNGGSGWHDQAYGIDVDIWGNVLVTGTVNPDGVTRNWNGKAFNGSTSSNNGDDMFAVKMGKVSGPIKLSVALAKNNISCHGLKDGTATASPFGGVQGYSFQWSNGDTANSVSGLSAGMYYLTVTDTANNIAIDSVLIIDPTILTDTLNPTHVKCYGDSSGEINLTVSGGTAPYSFAWSNLDSVQNATQLKQGSYWVTITDVNGCAKVDSMQISQPQAPLSNQVANINHLKCYGDTNGAIQLVVSGGTPPYSQVWSSGDTTTQLSQKKAGVYLFLLSDANQCVHRDTFQINQPLRPLLGQVKGTDDVRCFGGSDGSIDVVVIGGTPPYSYQWANGDTSEDISGLQAGSYFLTVTDSNLCTSQLSAIIGQPATALNGAFSNIQNILCYNDTSGQAEFNASGGTPPYTYFWSNGDSLSLSSSLKSGTHQVTVEDKNRCSFVDSIILTQPTSPVSAVGSSSPQSTHQANGKAWVTVTGGTPGYTYQWNDSLNQTGDTAHGLNAGVYQVVFTDMNGCSDSLTLEVSDSIATGISEYDQSQVKVYPNPSTGIFTVQSAKAQVIEIYHVTGVQVYRKSRNGEAFSVVDLSKERPGSYVLIVYFENSVYKQPLILKH